jgi:lactoylglutathione lyase
MAKKTQPPKIDLNNPRLLVRDFARSWTFYTKTLGLAPVSGDGTPPYGELGSSERFLGLFSRDAMDELIGPAASLTDAPDKFSLVFEVPDVDRTLGELEKTDVPIEIGPTDRPDWGLRTIHLRDPDGNLVEVYSRLARVKPRPARKRAGR